MTSETKVGIVALLVIAVAIVAWSRLGSWSRLKGEYRVIVCFDDLRGLPIGAPVLLHGVKIGEVTDIDLKRPPDFPGKPARAWLSIERQHTLYAGDTFQISSSSLLGGKHIKVTPSGKSWAALDKRKVSIVEGSGPAGIEALAENAQALTVEARGATASVNKLLRDEQIRADLKATLAGMRTLAERATQVATKALQLVDKLGPRDAEKVQAMVDNLYEVSRSLRRTAAGMNAMVSTTTLPADLNRISANLTEASESVRRSTEAVESIVADPKTTEELRGTIENAREISERGVEIAEKTTEVLEHVDDVVTKVDTAIGGLPSLANPFRNMEVEGQGDVRLGSGPAGRIDVALDLYPNRYRDDFWRIGVRDLGAEERLDLQRGFPLGRRGERVRVGIFEGKLGAGWDRDWSARLSSEVELIDPDEFRLDIRGRYRYSPDWDLVFGVDRALSGTEPFIGARRHFDF